MPCRYPNSKIWATPAVRALPRYQGAKGPNRGHSPNKFFSSLTAGQSPASHRERQSGASEPKSLDPSGVSHRGGEAGANEPKSLGPVVSHMAAAKPERRRPITRFVNLLNS